MASYEENVSDGIRRRRRRHKIIAKICAIRISIITSLYRLHKPSEIGGGGEHLLANCLHLANSGIGIAAIGRRCALIVVESSASRERRKSQRIASRRLRVSARPAISQIRRAINARRYRVKRRRRRLGAQHFGRRPWRCLAAAISIEHRRRSAPAGISLARHRDLSCGARSSHGLARRRG